MAKSAPQLEWCIVRLGDDHNWWVEEVSDAVRWDVDGLSIIDPRQVQHIIELVEPLRDYAFEQDLMERAFFPFRIEKDLGGGRVRLARVKDSLFESEDKLFAPYQVFEFDKKGGMKHMTSAKPFTGGQLSLFDSAPQVTRYGVDRNGILVLVNPSWDAPLKYQCHVVTKTKDAADPKSPRAGDLLLISTDDRGREAWSKLLRKGHPD